MLRRCVQVAVIVVTASVVLGRRSSALQVPYQAQALEISQSQQIDPRPDCPTGLDRNEVQPLIAKRRTGARLYVTQNDALQQNLEGFLVVKRNGTIVWSGKSLNTVEAASLPTSVCLIVRDYEESTLNFEVPSRKMTIGNYIFTAYVVPVGGNPYVIGVPIKSVTATTNNRRPPRILGVPINWVPLEPDINHGVPDSGLIDEASGVMDLAWGAWPLAEATGTKRYSLYELEYPVFTLARFSHCDLSSQMHLLGMRISPRPDFVYGFFKGIDLLGLRGWVCESGFGGVGSTNPDTYEMIFAHEFGHKIGNAYAMKDLGLSDDSIGQTGWNVLKVLGAGRARPISTHPVMGTEHLSEDTWADITNYRTFTEVSGTTLRPGWPAPESDQPPIDSTVVSLEPGAGGSWEISYALDVHGAVRAIEPVTDTGVPGRLRVLDYQGTELYTTGIITPTSFAIGGPAPAVTWSVTEYPDLNRAETLELIWNGVVTDVMTRSTNAPSVSMTSPAPGATLGITTTVQWTTSDLDDDNLTVFVEYTHDGGATIIPLSGSISAGSQVVIQTDELPASANGTISLRVTDGFNTTIASVGNLIVGPNRVPKVSIISPRNGAIYRSGTLPILSGVAHDPEDRTLPDNNLKWTSSIDGVLGYGEMLEVTLSLGTHMITFEATDSQGGIGTASISLAQQ